jgi:hypothetical protein
MEEDGIFSAQPVRRIWHQHLASSHNHEQLLWSILMFQAWYTHWRSAEDLAPCPRAVAAYP